MNENASSVIRLLHQGLTSPSGKIVAAPFSPQELAESPLSPGLLASKDWTPREENGLQWLEYPAAELPAPLYMTGPVSSTLDAAELLSCRGLFPEWAFLLSLSQSEGRGQMRRTWSSPAGNLYAALRLPAEGPFATLAAAPAIGALAAEALTDEGFPVLLKWPNDLLQCVAPDVKGGTPTREGYRKVAGILLEERRNVLTAGIGINITSCPDISTLRDNYAFCAGTLQRTGEGAGLSSEIEKNEENKNLVSIFTLAKRLVCRMFSCYSYKSASVLWWSALAEKHLAFRGSRIVLGEACSEDGNVNGELCEGIVDGVTPSGALRLRTEYGMDTFLGGSLLPRS